MQQRANLFKAAAALMEVGSAVNAMQYKVAAEHASDANLDELKCLVKGFRKRDNETDERAGWRCGRMLRDAI